MDTLRPLLAMGEKGSGHVASSLPTIGVGIRLVSQEPFVCKVVTDPLADASDLSSRFGSNEATLNESVDCPAPWRAARTAASILVSTLRARRVRLTTGISTVVPVVRMLDRAVDPSASSSAIHARAMLQKTMPAVEFTHTQNAAPTAASTAAGTIKRHSHKRLGQTTIYSKSRK